MLGFLFDFIRFSFSVLFMCQHRVEPQLLFGLVLMLIGQLLWSACNKIMIWNNFGVFIKMCPRASFNRLKCQWHKFWKVIQELVSEKRWRIVALDHNNSSFSTHMNAPIISVYLNKTNTETENLCFKQIFVDWASASKQSHKSGVGSFCYQKTIFFLSLLNGPLQLVIKLQVC